jgi:hypothetical protein
MAGCAGVALGYAAGLTQHGVVEAPQQGIPGQILETPGCMVKPDQLWCRKRQSCRGLVQSGLLCPAS